MKANLRIVLLLAAMLLPAVGNLRAQPTYESNFEPEEPDASPTRWSVSGKVLYHIFWKQGLLNDGEAYGRPGLGATNLAGFGGEIEFDYHVRPFLLVSGTLGGYRGKTDLYKIDILTGYALATAKLQKVTRFADYYLGAGVGAYYSRMDADGTSNALKPGIHGLLGIRIHVAPKWSVSLEDRLAFTMHAEEGFGDLDLGGNFLLLGGTRSF